MHTPETSADGREFAYSRIAIRHAVEEEFIRYILIFTQTGDRSTSGRCTIRNRGGKAFHGNNEASKMSLRRDGSEDRARIALPRNSVIYPRSRHDCEVFPASTSIQELPGY